MDKPSPDVMRDQIEGGKSSAGSVSCLESSHVSICTSKTSILITYNNVLHLALLWLHLERRFKTFD